MNLEEELARLIEEHGKEEVVTAIAKIIGLDEMVEVVEKGF